MFLKRLVPLVLMCGALSACSTWDALTDTNLDELRTASASGSTAFNDALANEYLALAAFEADEMFDHVDADHFAKKGLMAAAGDTVLPENPFDDHWDLPEGAVAEASGVRSRLIDLLDAGRRDDMPETAARAQSRFDCWIEQWEENFQDTHIATCRQDLFLALEQMEEEQVTEAAPPPPPVPEPTAPAPPPPPGPNSYLCFFDFDSAEVDLECQEVVSLVREDLTTYPNPSISVVGHTDTSGSNAYNLALSTRRADNVLNEMIGQGISRDLVTEVGARGEEVLRVPTPDGTRERENRRVEITLEERFGTTSEIFLPPEAPTATGAPEPVSSSDQGDPAITRASGGTGAVDPSDPYGLRGLEPYLSGGSSGAATDPSDPYGLRGLEPYLTGSGAGGGAVPPAAPPAASDSPSPLSIRPAGAGSGPVAQAVPSDDRAAIQASLAETERLLAGLQSEPDRIQEALAISRDILNRYQ